MAWVHGDLNGANSCSTRRGTCGSSTSSTRGRGTYSRISSSSRRFFYILTPLEDDAALAQALTLSDRLCEVDDLAAPLPPPEALGITHPGLARAWQTAGCCAASIRSCSARGAIRCRR